MTHLARGLGTETELQAEGLLAAGPSQCLVRELLVVGGLGNLRSTALQEILPQLQYWAPAPKLKKQSLLSPRSAKAVIALSNVIAKRSIVDGVRKMLLGDLRVLCLVGVVLAICFGTGFLTFSLGTGVLVFCFTATESFFLSRHASACSICRGSAEMRTKRRSD